MQGEQTLRKLALLALPALLAPMAIFATSTAAHADITTGCADTNECNVYESMGNGYCIATIWQSDSAGNYEPSGTYAEDNYEDNDSGYTCDFWFERDVRDTGWYQVGSTIAVGSGDGSEDVPSGPFFDGGGYQGRTCFQFNWGSSLGAVHCSSAITYIG